MSIEVGAGLACVRELAIDHALLWQSAPGLTLTLRVEQSGPFDLELWNSPRHVELEVLAGRAAVSQEAGESPTRHRFILDIAEPGVFELSITTPGWQREPFRVALMSDVQEAIDRVQDIYDLINRERDLDFLLGAGDLTQRGTRSQLMRFEKELVELEIPYYTTLGNHELGVDTPLFQELFGRGSFSFEHRGVRFTLLDSASATLDARVYGWLDAWLQRGRDQLHIVAMHIPPLDPIGVRNGSFASRNEAAKLLARLLAGHVDLTLYGHIHSYYRFENAGIAARISGGGGAIPERFDRMGRHFLTLELDPIRQTFETHVVRVD